MNKKAIKRHLEKKFDDFLISIKDESVKKLIEKNSIITGGCIPSMMLGEKVNDYDLYFTNKETVLAVADYYAKMVGGEVIDVDKLKKDDPQESEYFNLRGIYQPGRVAIWKKAETQEIELNEDDKIEENPEFVFKNENPDESEPYSPLFITPSAITLSNKIQIVLRFYGNAKEIHTNFDFLHATNYWESDKEKIFVNQPALEAILAKELIYIGSKYPLASLFRMRKFINRGWIISAGQIIKIAWQISELDLKNNAVLQDQLVGVDIAFMTRLVEAIKAKLNSEPDKVNYEFVSELIDKFF